VGKRRLERSNIKIGPTFLGIGAQKSASSWLHNVLDQSGEVFMPPVKELHYFDRIDSEAFPTNLKSSEHDKVRNQSSVGIRTYKKSRSRYLRNAKRILGYAAKGDMASISFYYKFLFQKRSIEWYGSLFRSKCAVRGEITPRYALLSDQKIEEITTHFPDLKVIYLIRNPVDRAWSVYRYMKTRESTEPTRLEEAIDFLEKEKTSYHWRYVENTARWRRHLKPGHLMIGFYDAVVMQPEALLADISRHLGCKFVQPTQAQVNQSLRQEMTETFRAMAEEIFNEELDRLSETLGGYSLDWRNGVLLSKSAHPPTLAL
jgi:hypothetical protein